MSAESLGAALADAGMHARVESRDRLAIVAPLGSGAGAAIVARRSELCALASAHGFSHVALEVDPAADDAR